MKRNEIDTTLTWNMEDIYKSEKELMKDFVFLNKYINKVKKFRGKLNSAIAIKEFYDFFEAINLKQNKVHSYIALKYDEDMSSNKYQLLKSKYSEFCSRFSSIMAFANFEILSLEENKLNEILNDDIMKKYKRSFYLTTRYKSHILPEKLEKISIEIGKFSSHFYESFQSFDSTDVDYGEIVLDNGEQVKLTNSLFSYIYKTQSENVRKQVSKQENEPYFNHRHLLGKIYIGHLKSEWFNVRTSNFDSCLSGAMFSNEVPEQVYLKLLKQKESSDKISKRYYSVLKDALNLKKMYFYDTYLPIGKIKEEKVSWEECVKKSRKVLEVLGDDYLKLFDKAMNERWSDAIENENKCTGAYASDVYGVHPYMLFNFDNTLSYASTIIHEVGHAIHFYLSEQNNSYYDCGVSAFCSEVASTVNEVLLSLHNIDSSKEDSEKLKYYLRELIFLFKSTFCSQLNFAMFEEEAHNLVEKNLPITIDILSDIYNGINGKSSDGIIEKEKKDSYSFMGIPHFYYFYYVYQYATGITAAINIATKIYSGDKTAKENYMKFLSDGNRQSPYESLKIAGVDLMSDEPYTFAMDFINKKIDELEESIREDKTTNKNETIAKENKNSKKDKKETVKPKNLNEKGKNTDSIKLNTIKPKTSEPSHKTKSSESKTNNSNTTKTSSGKIKMQKQSTSKS